MRLNIVKESCFVASNEHAAEVIGRNGWKIKSIACISGTSIRCPTPKEAPIFYITGYRSDVERAKKMIKMWADNFDRMKDKKRAIKCGPGDLVETVMLSRADISPVIGRQGKQVKKIATLANVTIISPDINKEPIFIISGKKPDLDLAIFWIKLTAFSATRANYFEMRQKSLLARTFLELEGSIDKILINRTSSIINLKKVNLTHLSQILKSIKVSHESIAEPYQCHICLSTKLRMAKAICGHIICCDFCIVKLFQDIYLRCRTCSLKVDNFLILS